MLTQKPMYICFLLSLFGEIYFEVSITSLPVLPSRPIRRSLRIQLSILHSYPSSNPNTRHPNNLSFLKNGNPSIGIHLPRNTATYRYNKPSPCQKIQSLISLPALYHFQQPTWQIRCLHLVWFPPVWISRQHHGRLLARFANQGCGY